MESHPTGVFYNGQAHPRTDLLATRGAFHGRGPRDVHTAPRSGWVEAGIFVSSCGLAFGAFIGLFVEAVILAPVYVWNKARKTR